MSTLFDVESQRISCEWLREVSGAECGILRDALMSRVFGATILWDSLRIFVGIFKNFIRSTKFDM